MRSMRRSFVFALLAVGVFGASREAKANGLEIPENGTEVMGRGGAWTARADNPLAAALNPAGLAGQKSGVILNANLTWQSECFQRAGTYPNGGNVSGTNYQSDYEGQAYPKVCKKNAFKDINVVPQLGFSYAVTPKLGIGILPLWTPSGTGKAVWPDDKLDANHVGDARTASGTPAPAPQRFMLLNKEALIIMPTFAAGYEIAPGLRVGAAFQWVITVFKSSVSSQATQSSAQDVAQGPYNTTRSDVSWTQIFTPAAVLGAMYTPSDDIDIGGMFRWSADIVKKGGTVSIYAPYYGKSTRPDNTPAKTDVTLKEFRIPQPWDARLGFRYHAKRKDVEAPKEGRRDLLTHDQFDVELDLTFEHNSQMDKLTILFDTPQSVAFGSNQTAGHIPGDASIEKHWKDTYGARLGADYVVLPEKLAARVGTFIRSNGQDERYLNIDFHPGMMFGFFVGGTLRVTKSVDVALGYGHIFVKDFDNTATGGALRGLTAADPDPGSSPDNAYAICPKPTPAYRTCEVSNTGKLSTSYNMFSIGSTVHF